MGVLKKRIIWLIILISISILLLLGIRSNVNILSKAVLTTSNFIRVGIGKSVLIGRNVLSLFKTNSALRKENRILKEDLHSYQEQYKSVDALLYETQRLRELLQFSYSVDYNLLPANIVIAAKDEGKIGYIIDQGSNEGVMEGMVVCAIQDQRLVLLGRIVVTQSYSSVMEPLLHNNVSFAVISDQSREKGILEGNNEELSVIFDSIYDSHKVLVGEEVQVQEYSILFPRGLPVGTISSITTDSEHLLLRAQVEPFIKIDDVDVVFILLSQEE